MPKLQDYLVTDLATFFNLGEFAGLHNIDGLQVPAVVDSDILKTRSSSKAEQYEGIYKGEIAVYVKAADLPHRPVFGQEMQLDGKSYLVVECTEDMGVLEIVLGANVS